MARPRNLPTDLAAIKAAGVDTVISLLEPAEAATVGLYQEAETCVALGMTYLNHPIRDMHLPDPIAFAAFSADVAERIRGGAHVAVHCYASVGRSGMLTCTTLGHFSYTSVGALTHVSQMRGVPVPDTDEQTAFIHRMMATTQP